VNRYSFSLFFDAWSDSSWNSLFVLKNESSTESKVAFVDFSLPGTKVQTNEKSDICIKHATAHNGIKAPLNVLLYECLSVPSYFAVP